MKSRLIILLLAIPLLVNGQETIDLDDLVVTSTLQNPTKASAKVHEFVRGLATLRSSSDVTLLKKVFHKTQRKFLREYVSYSDFSEIFESGRFDCLTATALYSYVLGELNFDFSIIETNYHIFLLVKTSKGEILLETTDRYNGFVSRSDKIGERIGAYRTKALDGKNQYRYQCDLYDEVSPNLLPGLLYYNQAVKAFNAGSLEKCGDLLLKARSIHNTARVDEFGSIFLKSVVESSLDDATKLRIIRQFKGISPAKSPVLASR